MLSHYCSYTDLAPAFHRARCRAAAQWQPQSCQYYTDQSKAALAGRSKQKNRTERILDKYPSAFTKGSGNFQADGGKYTYIAAIQFS